MTLNRDASNQLITKQWYHGFDWLRTIFIIFVILIHLDFTLALSGDTPEVTVFDILKYNVLFLAVPGFLLISSYLLVTHCNTWSEYAKKIKSILALYLFWVGAWIVVTKPIPEMSLWGITEFFLRGGGWAYYFFAVLLINSILTALFHRSSTATIWAGFIISLIISQGMFHLMASQQHAWTHISTYWWPISFIPIPFVAVLFSRYHSAITMSLQLWWTSCVVLFVLAMGFAIIEWKFCADAGATKFRLFLPEYLRVSLVFGSALLILITLKVKYSPSIVKWISKNSLGIFCLHVFMLRGISSRVQGRLLNETLANLVTLVIVVVVCGTATEVLKRLLRERII